MESYMQTTRVFWVKIKIWAILYTIKNGDLWVIRNTELLTFHHQSFFVSWDFGKIIWVKRNMSHFIFHILLFFCLLGLSKTTRQRPWPSFIPGRISCGWDAMLHFIENHVTKNWFFCDVICLDFVFLHFLYKLAINRAACGGQKVQKLPKITTLWKSLTKAIDYA